MSRIRLFESRGVPEAERLAGLRLEMVTPLARRGRWRREAPHVEPLPVLLWIARGQGRITVDAWTRGVGPATCVVIPAHTPFAIEPGIKTEGTLLRMPDLFEAPLPPSPRRLRLSDVGVQAELAGLLDALARPGDLIDPPNGRAALARVILISALVERVARGAPPEAATAPARLAARFAREVEARLGSGHNLAAIGAALDVTSTHLTRTLRATCGMTAAQYLNERLMHEARRRLADTDENAATIARSLGFSSAAYFTRAFGRITGKTPSEFRRVEGRALAG
ncbi:MAG: AraC family transcriptional regulator [Jannaschia sp.]